MINILNLRFSVRIYFILHIESYINKFFAKIQNPESRWDPAIFEQGSGFVRDRNFNGTPYSVPGLPVFRLISQILQSFMYVELSVGGGRS